MAEQDAQTHDLGTEAIAAVQHMQELTDLEGDLADTALSVVAGNADAADPTPAPAPAAGGEQLDHPSAADVVMQAAEAMENAIEQSIPDAPIHSDIPAPAAAPEGSEQPAQPAEPAETAPDNTGSGASDAVPTPISDQVDSTTAQEAVSAMAVVNADIDQPVLPENVVPAAHDIALPDPMEETSAAPFDLTPAPETSAPSAPEPNPSSAVPLQSTVVETMDAKVDIVPATESSAPVTHESSNGASTALPVAVTSVVSVPDAPGPSTLAPAAPQQPAIETAQHRTDTPVSSAEVVKQEIGTLPGQTPFRPIGSPSSVAPFPAGLTTASASVAQNPHLIHEYHADPRNPRVLLALFNWAVQKSEVQDARAWYAVLGQDEPTAVQPLLALINLELALSNFPAVEALFGTALKGSSGEITAAADVSIWKAYLHYARRQHPVAEGAPNSDQARTTITQAYEFALSQCGTDRESGEIWQEYITFTSEGPNKNTWDAAQVTDNLRKIYSRAVRIPLNNVEALWKAYDAWENAQSKATAKKHLAERSPAYMTARTALRELRNLTEPLPHPVLPVQPTFSDEDRRLVAAWKAYLKWEEGNPLVIEDKEVLDQRIGYALRKCLGEMRHFPELWHFAANYYIGSGNFDEAAGVLQAGVDACPRSVLVTFALADVEEERKNLADVHAAYEKLLEPFPSEINTLTEDIEREVNAARGPELAQPAQNGDVNMDGNDELARLTEEREARGKAVQDRRGKEIDSLSTAMTVVWIMYLRFARRAEGIKSARGIFGKARKSAQLTWHIFEASAMMEYHSSKDSALAIRIFELGLKRFPEEPDFVTKYLQFLININDDNNARALFGRAADKIPVDRARPLWDAWARYEYLYGDFAAVQRLEARFAEVFPNDSPLKRFAQRFTFNGIDEIALRDLGFGRPSRPPAPVPSVPVPADPSRTATDSFRPHPSLPPHPPVTGPADPPPFKRPHSPGPGNGHGHGHGQGPGNFAPRRQSIDRSISPSRDDRGNKRYRPSFSPPPSRRFPPPEPQQRGRYGSDDRSRERYSRDMSPQRRAYSPSGRQGGDRFSQPTPPNQGPAPYGGLPPVPPPNGGYSGPPPPGQRLPDDRFDRSGVTKPLAWFIGSLPSTQAFDGPVFRPDDIIGLFNNNILPDGTRSGGPRPPIGGIGGPAPAGMPGMPPQTGMYQSSMPSGVPPPQSHVPDGRGGFMGVDRIPPPQQRSGGRRY